MLVEQLHHKRSNMLIPEIGDCVEVDNSSFKVAGQVVSGSIMVDGLGVGDVGNVVLRDRLSLAEDGILVCVAGVDKKTRRMVADLEIVSRGCFFQGDTNTESPVDEVRQEIVSELNKLTFQTMTIAGMKSAIQRAAKHYFRVKLKRNPIVLPIIIEV